MSEKKDLLIKQREQLVGNIEKLNVALHTLFFTLITLVSSLSVLLYTTFKLNELTSFILSQFIIILTIFVIAIIFAENNNRDYIRAIDDYLEEIFGIDVMIRQSHIDRRHIIGWRSKFSMLMILLACVSAISVVTFIVVFIWSYINTNVLFVFILLLEAIALLFLIILNIIDKGSKNTQVYLEVREYLFRNIDINN